MLRLSAVCCLLLSLLLCGCGSATARKKHILKSDPDTLSGDELAQREEMLRRMDEDRRAGKSSIPGLSIGQLEDMPELPPLPEFIDANATLDQLALHAKLTAEAEDSWLLPSTVDVDERVTYLLYYWTPQFEVKQARLQKMEHGRKTLNHRYQERVSQQTQWREEREALDREWSSRLSHDRMQINTLVE